MKVALIGHGMVADMHVAAISATGGAVELLGVLGRTPESTANFASRHGVAVYRDLDALASDPDLDAAIVLTPPDSRLNFVTRLASEGKALLLEKPLERDLARATELVEICEAAHVPMTVFLQHRKRPAAERLMRLLDQGALGEIATLDVRVPWWRPQSYYDAPGRGTFARDGGGVLITQAIHTLDLMLCLAGPVTAAQAMTSSSALHRIEAEDFVTASLSFASGAVGSLMASTTHFPGDGESLTINGTLGSATLSSAALKVQFHDGQVIEDGAAAGTGGGANPMAFSHAWHQAVLEDMAKALKAGRPPRITGRSALPVHALIDAIQMSAARGQRVALAGSEGPAPPNHPGIFSQEERG